LQAVGIEDHPAYAEDLGVGEPAGATIIGLHDRVVRRPERHVDTQGERSPAVLPVSAVSARRTVARLARLGTEWYVVHDLPAGVDHLVVGGAGVFALTDARLVGNVMVAGHVLLHNGQRTDHVEQATARARWVSTKLARATGGPVVVTPVLVVETERLAVKVEATDVGVVTSHRLHKWLERQPTRIDKREAFRLAAATHRAGTWR
jgi:hypothetical protein